MTSYHLDKAAFRVEVLNAPFMVAEMKARAEKALAFAESIAPVDPKAAHPGLYKASFSADSGTNGGVHHDRAWGELSNDAMVGDFPLAVAVEFGTQHQAGQYVLTQALDVMRG